MTNFSIDLVKKVARLARIRITDQEASKFSIDLTAIVNEIEILQELDTSQVKPLSNVTEKEMILRKDEVTDGNIVNKVLANAHNANFNCFIVPKVIE